MQQQPRFGTEPYSKLLAKDQAWKQPPVRQVPRAGAAHRDVINSSGRIRAGLSCAQELLVPAHPEHGGTRPTCVLQALAPLAAKNCAVTACHPHTGCPALPFSCMALAWRAHPPPTQPLQKQKGKKKKKGVSQGKKQLWILSLGCLNEWINYTLSFHNYAYAKLHNERSLPKFCNYRDSQWSWKVIKRRNTTWRDRTATGSTEPFSLQLWKIRMRAQSPSWGAAASQSSSLKVLHLWSKASAPYGKWWSIPCE